MNFYISFTISAKATELTISVFYDIPQIKPVLEYISTYFRPKKSIKIKPQA